MDGDRRHHSRGGNLLFRLEIVLDSRGGMTMNSIFEATKKICIEHQDEAENSALAAQWLVKHGLTLAAKSAQCRAAEHADEAMLRLFRLIGTY